MAFSAAFYQEDAASAEVDEHLPEVLVHKGRSRVDDFKKFLGDKLKGDKWKVHLAKGIDREVVDRAFSK